jgi:sugar/nucleoside kinase (ribokinase family)
MLQPVASGALGIGNQKTDVLITQLLDQVLQHIGAGDVQVGAGAQVEVADTIGTGDTFLAAVLTFFKSRECSLPA